AKRTASDSPAIVSRRTGRQNQHKQQRRNHPPNRHRKRRAFPSKQPEKKRKRRGQAEEQTFVRAAIGENRESDAHEQCVAPALEPHDSPQSSKNESSPGPTRRSTPVAIRPITEDTQTRNRDQPADQCPSWGEPSLQHPADCGAHYRYAQADSDERLAKQDLAQR